MATLVAVNWVERRADKENAIQVDGADIWQNLTLKIKEVCESFNTRYGHQYSKVTVNSEGTTRIRISRTLTRNIGPDQSRPETVSLQVAYEPANLQITAACSTITVAAKVDLEFDTERSIRAFLASDGEQISDDKASEILTKDFLFSKKFLPA